MFLVVVDSPNQGTMKNKHIVKKMGLVFLFRLFWSWCSWLVVVLKEHQKEY